MHYAGETVTDEGQFRHETVDAVRMNYADADRLDLRGMDIAGKADMSHLSAENLYAWAIDVGSHHNLSRSEIAEDLDLSSGESLCLDAKYADIGGDVDLKRYTAGHAHFPGSRIGGRLKLGETDVGYVNLRGADLTELWAADLSEDRVLVDDETCIGGFREGYGMNKPALGPAELELLAQLVSRPKFPPTEQNVLFQYEDLGKDLVMTPSRRGAFGSLVGKGAVRPIDSIDTTYYLARTDLL